MPTQKTRREERVRERERQSTHTHTCRRELPAPSPLAPLFLCFFLPDLPCVNWASQECPLFCRRSSLWSSDLPLFYFHGLFPSLSFSLCHSGLLFPILTIYGTPLQYPCLENPMDGRACKAAVHGVAEDQTQLKQLNIHSLMRLHFLSQVHLCAYIC